MAALLMIREEHVTGHFVLMENQTNADNRMDIVPSLNGSMFFFGRAGQPQRRARCIICLHKKRTGIQLSVNSLSRHKKTFVRKILRGNIFSDFPRSPLTRF
jgi:hypothetical protein